MKLVIRILVTAFIVVALSNFLPGAHIYNYMTGIWVAITIGLLNLLIKPLLIIFTLPVTILTLGLFLFVINAIVIMIASSLISGFYVDGFWWALVFSILLSVCQSFLFAAFEKR